MDLNNLSDEMIKVLLYAEYIASYRMHKVITTEHIIISALKLNSKELELFLKINNVDKSSLKRLLQTRLLDNGIYENDENINCEFSTQVMMDIISANILAKEYNIQISIIHYILSVLRNNKEISKIIEGL